MWLLRLQDYWQKYYQTQCGCQGDDSLAMAIEPMWWFCGNNSGTCWTCLNCNQWRSMMITNERKKSGSKKAQSKETLLTMASRALPWSTHNNNNSVSYKLSWHAKLLVHIPLVFCDRQACGEYLSVIHVINLSKKITQCNLLTAFHKNRRGGIRWQQHFQPTFKLSHDKSAFSPHTHTWHRGASAQSRFCCL